MKFKANITFEIEDTDDDINVDEVMEKLSNLLYDSEFENPTIETIEVDLSDERDKLREII